MRKWMLIFLGIELLIACDGSRVPASQEDESCVVLLRKIAREINGEHLRFISLEEIRLERVESGSFFFEGNVRQQYSIGDAQIDLQNISRDKTLVDSVGRKWQAQIDEAESLILTAGDSVKRVTLQELTTEGFSYQLRIADRYKIEVVMPDFTNEYRDYLLAHLKKGLTTLSENEIEILEQINVMPFENVVYRLSGGGIQMGSANWNGINLFPNLWKDFDPDSYGIVLRHEFGHKFAYAVFGEYTPPQEWVNAIARDSGKFSSIARRNSAEDFAEAVDLYLRINSGESGLAGYQTRYTHRFRLLDQLFLNDAPRRYRVQSLGNALRKARIPALFIATVGGGAGYFLFSE